MFLFHLFENIGERGVHLIYVFAVLDSEHGPMIQVVPPSALMMPPAGFEPATYGLEGRCSVR
jgi:hypothetical protein